ncbi:hypothetical protein [Plantactinospora sp. GCM10030261]|uniref:hypothetical protein n=1 Tax=Plantactinospora sp. GCM10030261 TaxID=3273420 RepID=UPI0036222AAE
MQDSGERPIYRIRRLDAGVLHLYRGDVLVDVDRKDGGDSREDIERWGTAVAWAEDRTCIERWDSPDADEDWRTLIGLPYRYMTWQIEDEGAAAWAEVDSTGWVRRYVEAKDLGQICTAAASLEEVIAARDAGGVEAVRAYEAIYGVAPEVPLPPDAEPTPTPITAYEFARRWITARDELGANQRST